MLSSTFRLHLRSLSNVVTIGLVWAHCALSQIAPASGEASAKYDHGLRHFYWLYTYDPAGHQRRDWYQESSATWNEIYEDGRYNHSRIVDAHAEVDGNTGIVAVADTATLRLFIPDTNAHGANPGWLRIQQPGSTTWTFLAPLIEVPPAESRTAVSEISVGTQSTGAALSSDQLIDSIALTINKQSPRIFGIDRAVGSVHAVAESTTSISIPAHDGCLLTARFRSVVQGYIAGTPQNAQDGIDETVWRIDLRKMQPSSTHVGTSTARLKDDAVCTSGDCTIQTVNVRSSGFEVKPLSCSSKREGNESDCIDDTKAKKVFAFEFHDPAVAGAVSRMFRDAITACGGHDDNPGKQ
jgi:hypothetical protein